jgi:DNA-binding transcriptional LysR family regulator
MTPQQVTSPTLTPWPAIELRELRVFLTVAEELHFGRAADRLQINRSRVSQIVLELEAKLGTRVFDRTSRRVALTPVGGRLLADLTPAYRELERVLRETRESATGVAGPLRIGIYARVSCGPHWPAIVRTFTARHPGCEIEMIDTKFDRNYLDVPRHAEVDMLATRLPLSDADMTVGPILSREPRVLLVAKDDVLAARDSVRLEDFADRAIPDNPAMPREMMDAFFPPLALSGRKIRRITIRSFEEGMLLVAAGRMVHPTVASYLSYYMDQGVVSVPIADLPPSETALVWLTAKHSPKVQAFAHAAADVLGRSPVSGSQS